VLGLIGTLFSAASRYQSGVVSTSAVYYLRRDIYRAINRQSFSFFDKTETGQLISRATSDIELTGPLFGMGITFSIQASITIMMTMIMVTLMVPVLSLILWISIPIYIIIIFIYSLKLKSPFLKSRESFGDLTTIIRENILGSQVVRIFNSVGKENEKFVKENRKFLDYTVESIKYQSVLMQLSRFFVGLILIIGFFIAGRMVFDGQIILPTFLAFIAYLAIIASPLWMMVNVLVQFVQADAALTRINEVIENTPEIKETKDAISAKNLEGKIQFVDVNFGYTSAMVLKDLNFEILPGEKVALLGTTGSGKSTLISLLPRFYDPVSGKILMDGVDIRNYKIKELREQIGYVSQNIFLFNTSIKDNISFGKEDATLEEIEIAADSADIVDFIESLPDKYETVVGERGTQLSGGQKQRIAIARALLIKPKILILDDSTSSVDVETEFKIQSALKTLMQNRTTFIITQRISTIRDADKILVMDRGRIIGLGTHEELIEQNVLYKQIYETLFKKQKQLNSQIQLSKTEVMKHE
jgi:ATP-binding cassette subfamily B protein